MYPELFQAELSSEFRSKLLFKKAFKKDEIICSILGYTNAKKSWSTIQISENEHCELNSELVLMNHSCEPTVKINVKSMQVIALRDVNAGINFLTLANKQRFFIQAPNTNFLNHSSAGVDQKNV